ncbi:aldehyde dehydrogenase family protein [Brucellaceae bacterium VT-16-1752]|nr:aldehyde dehydrogenase family protein [Brucellaceae bacterium VT-16-1752]
MAQDTVARHWIDGEWRDGGSIEESHSPSTGRPLGRFFAGGADEAKLAVAAARRAFDTSIWAKDRVLRFRVLNELADRVEERSDAMISILARENGKIIPEAGFEVGSLAPTLRYYAGLALSDAGAASEAQPGTFFQTLREPIGVAGIIVPWNSPLALLVRSLAPALAAGCTVAVKMPGQTGLSNGLFYEAVAATKSLPKGIINLFTESGNEGSPFLVESLDVDVVSYTGSTKVGRIIAASGAKTLKRMNLELGGKTPMIVFEDADLDAVAPLLVRALTTFTGQFCMTGSRVLAACGIADALRARLVTLVGDVKVGPSDDASSQMGPVIDKQNVERIDRFVSEAEAYAKVLVRGGPVTEGPLAAGAFYRPSLLEVEDVSSPLVQQEVFGPVLSFEVFEDEADAIRRANATEFGLAAGVFTNDVSRSYRVSREIKAGTVWTNTWAAINDRFEEGGFRQSGIGRLRGSRGMEEFQETKTYVHVAPAAQ